MAKSSSPIRLQSDLMSAAELTAKRFHRSTAEQIEYWAEIGKKLSHIINPDVLLSVTAGLTTIKTETVNSQAIDPKTVFNHLNKQRDTGELSLKVSNSAVQYQASQQHIGLLEQINQDGTIITGTFRDGVFIPMTERNIEQ